MEERIFNYNFYAEETTDESDETYAALYQQISKLKADNPFIGKVMDFRGHTDCISYLKKVGALN